MFAVGAFLAFTLSQAGMVLHWMRQGDASSISKAALNALGCLATGTALCIVPYRKFAEGARFSLLFIAGMVIAFQGIRAHYDEIRAERSLHGLPPSLRPASPARAVVPISGVHRGIINAVRFAQYISSDVTGVYVELEPDSGVKVEAQWKEWWPDVSLVVVPSPYRSLIGPLLDFLDKTDAEHNDGQLAVVVLPEFVITRWWQNLLHNQTATLINAALLYGRRRAGGERLIVDVPYHLRK